MVDVARSIVAYRSHSEWGEKCPSKRKKILRRERRRELSTWLDRTQDSGWRDRLVAAGGEQDLELGSVEQDSIRSAKMKCGLAGSREYGLLDK
jgi:hypothetical protein